VALGRVGSDGQIELAPAAERPPPPQLVSELVGFSHDRHGPYYYSMCEAVRFPAGNRVCAGWERTLRRMSSEFDAERLVARYVAQWNEADPAARTALIRELWARDGTQVLLDPPEEIRQAAASLAFPVPPLEVRGHEAMDARVARAHEMFVASGEYVFEAAGAAPFLLPHVIGVRWAMVSKRDGEVVGRGLDILALDDDGKIRTDHQFIAAS
jgi:hypothetical protein